MSADEMFEELGYIEKRNYKDVEVYYDSKNKKNIEFDIYNKAFLKFSECDDSEILEFTMQELKAINKKCEELGWL